MGWASRKNALYRQRIQKDYTYIKEAEILQNSSSDAERYRLLEVLSSFRKKNTLAEIEGIRKKKQTPFQKARLIILEAVFDLAILDCYDDVEESKIKKLFAKIKTAAQDLVRVESNESLSDPLIWIFLPREVHRILDMAFDGVGDWRA